MIDHTILVDQKCHDTAGAIVRRKRYEAESTGGRKHAVVITVIGRVLAGSVIAFLGSLGNQRSSRAFGLAFFDFPIEPVLFTRFADDAGCVGACRLSVVGGKPRSRAGRRRYLCTR